MSKQEEQEVKTVAVLGTGRMGGAIARRLRATRCGGQDQGGGFRARVETRPTSLIDIAPTVLRHLRMDHDDTDGQALPQGA